MNREEFFQYILDNFNLEGASIRLISNILQFVEKHYPDGNEQQNALFELLDDTIGLEDEEIENVHM